MLCNANSTNGESVNGNCIRTLVFCRLWDISFPGDGSHTGENGKWNSMDMKIVCTCQCQHK